MPKEVVSMGMKEIRNKVLRLAAACCGTRYSKLIRYLIFKGADPNVPDSDGMTALMWMIAKVGSRLNEEYADTIKADVDFLLSHGADPNLKPNSGESLLEHAQEMGLMDIVSQLKNSGAV